MKTEITLQSKLHSLNEITKAVAFLVQSKLGHLNRADISPTTEKHTTIHSAAVVAKREGLYLYSNDNANALTLYFTIAKRPPT